MEEKNVLELAEPLLKTWSSDSHFMSMILLQENAIDWILNNYIIYMVGFFSKTTNML